MLGGFGLRGWSHYTDDQLWALYDATNDVDASSQALLIALEHEMDRRSERQFIRIEREA